MGIVWLGWVRPPAPHAAKGVVHRLKYRRKPRRAKEKIIVFFFRLSPLDFPKKGPLLKRGGGLRGCLFVWMGAFLGTPPPR